MSEDRIAMYWEKYENNDIKCGLCPHNCYIKENTAGKCGARENRAGSLIASGYGCVTSIALDPIEKKPLYMFHPGKKIVSIGGYGCNLNCPHCQNHNISMEYQKVKIEHMTPEIIKEIAVMAVEDGNIGVAYTYNEPLIGYEFVISCSNLIRREGLMNVLVTNGYINEEPLTNIIPLIDAMNIDIKGYHNRTYNKLGGTLEPVKRTIEMSHNECHIEVTTLVIPGENEDEVEEIALWLSKIDPNIPYHLSRFYPRYKYSDRAPTPPETMFRLRDTAEKYLNHVFIGNM